MAQIALPAMAATSLLQFSQQMSAGRIAKIEGETEARQIELATLQREVDRKESLARAMASQIAESGAKGISAFEGSPLTILQADIQAAEEAQRRDVAQSKIAAMSARARGSAAKRYSQIGAVTNLIGDVGQMAYVAPRMK